MKIDNTIVGSFRGFRNLGLFGVFFCLIGCSGEQIDGPGNEPQPATEQAIAFSADLPEESEEDAMTRAIPLEEELPVGNKKFTVWGYKNDAYDVGTSSYTSYQTVFPGYTVNWEANTAATTTSNTHDWEYVGINSQTIKYWDWSTEAYRFFGYALGNATSPATPNAVAVTGGAVSDAPSATAVTFSSTVDASTDATIAAAPYFSELWFSNDKTNDYGKPVTLRFLKPFARVRFLFTFIDGLTFGHEALSQIKFCPTVNADNDNTNDQPIYTTGTVTVSYPLKGTATTESWTTSGTTGINAFTIDHYATPATVPTGVITDPTDPGYDANAWPNSPGKWYTVMPCISQGAYKMSITVFGEEKTADIPAEYMQWKPGYEYTYKFKIIDGGSLILDIIQVGINQWVEKGPTDRYVYNW